MDIRQLRYFLAVAEEENIGRAAKRLFISQPPLTRQIQQLEEELNVQLFERTSKGVQLTPAGHLFLSETRNILSLMDRARERTQSAGKGELGRLDVAMFGSAIFKIIPEILQEFKHSYPEVDVVLHSMEKGEQIEALRQKRISVGFNRLLLPLPDIASKHIVHEKLMLAVNAKHPLAFRNSVQISDLKDEPIVAYPHGKRPNFVDHTARLFQDAGIAIKITQTVNDTVTAVALASGGFGMCIVPNSATVLSLPNVVYVPIVGLPENASVDLSCIFRKDDRSPLLSAFLSIVDTYIGNLRS